MRRILVLTVAMGLMMGLALPATAAPNNKNNADNVIPLTCEGLNTVAVRPNPGRGLPAWDVESGQHQVAKRFTFNDSVTVEIIDGGEGSASNTFEEVRDYGAEKGNKDLVECVSNRSFVDGPIPLDPGFAAILNADFGTDIFAAGQLVEITVESTLTVLALITGK